MNNSAKDKKNQINWPTIGNVSITDYLSKSLEKGDLTGAYIFFGPDNLGKTTLANLFAKAVLCQGDKSGALPCEECVSCKSLSLKTGVDASSGDAGFDSIHGDLHLIKKEKDKKNISIEQIREFIRKLNMSSFLNSYKIGIVKDAHLLSDEAANALLKTLEEPREKVIVILITSKIDLLPATIVSRAKTLNFKQADKDLIYDFLVNERGANRSAAKNFSRLCQGRYALAVKFLEDDGFRDEYLFRAEVFFNFASQSIIDRIKTIEALFKEDDAGQGAAAKAGKILEAWNGVVRDMVLLEYDLRDLIQYEILLEKLVKAKERMSFKKIMDLDAALSRARRQLAANVNPRLALENIAINI